jgi:hypothetical protein
VLLAGGRLDVESVLPEAPADLVDVGLVGWMKPM